jgi:hypothetical protein
VLAVAVELEAQAAGLEDRRGELIFELRESFLDTHQGEFSPAGLEEHLVNGWVSDIAAFLLAKYDAELQAKVAGHLRMNGVTVSRDAARVGELEAEGVKQSEALTDMQAEARRLGEEQRRLRIEAAQLAAAVAPRLVAVPA